MSNPDDRAVKLKRPTDFEILESFSDGKRDVGVNKAEEIGRKRGYINTRLPELAGHGLLDRVGPADRSGLYRITPRGMAALALRDQYDTGREYEELVDERAQDFEIIGPRVIDHAED